jgi:leader peptidase (prepilin peptidase) / N-methyltransferase
MLTDVELFLSLIANVPFFYYPFIFVVGLVVGSFLNVVIFRTPKIMEQAFRSECCEFLAISEKESLTKTETISLSKPNSTCPKCHNPIKPWHNIPIISYFLLLKGKCASCQTPISLRYPTIELATGLLSVLMISLLGVNTAGVVGLLLLWSLITLTMIDIDTQLLPDTITLPLLWLGLIANSFSLYTSLPDALWGAILGYLSLWCVFWLFKLITGKEGMGYGDFKLLAALGAWMGWQFLPVIILLSSFVGAAIGIAGIIILGRDKNIPIPFGPYLAIAGWIAFLWGDAIINAYFVFLGATP